MELGLILGLAAFIEGVVQYLKKSWSKWSLIALALGTLIAYGGSIDLLASSGFGDFPWWLGQGLTGLSLGFGSSFIHDFVATKRV